MYLKSIEMHGFKSFANRIVLDFHNGITGIVGPNGSGKSNVADAVRWVLGEQSARQLRGANMQDVIFAGTENRKPLSYAYVSITLDNADHVLPVSFDEVTVARRVYRSGESEYLLNGTVCRLKDVQELFYDTGIGKEGYSIIGQGQIERILSGKPEERRELFDEAVGIVKFKKRKLVAQKKLAEEQENLVRVTDILGELEDRVEPLERQAKSARRFLELKETQKKLDVNLFLADIEQMSLEIKETNHNKILTESQLEDAKQENEKIHEEYHALEESILELEQTINQLRDEEQEQILSRGKNENRIHLIEEQIRSIRNARETFEARKAEIDAEIRSDEDQVRNFKEEQESLKEKLEGAALRLDKAKEYYTGIRDEIARLESAIEKNNEQSMSLMEERSDATSEEERLKTMEEQVSIRKAGINQRLLAQRTQADEAKRIADEMGKKHEEAKSALEELRALDSGLKEKEREWNQKSGETSKAIREEEREQEKLRARLESLRSITERYEGYGNAVKRVMEQKDHEPGLIGVIADLISVPRKYETAIETALGGSIQHIVTEDEDVAKRMISFLKKNKAGRATFLPITSVDGRRNKNASDVSGEPGVCGIASSLVDYDNRFEGIISYLLGRVVVTDNIDAALALARKMRFSLNIVTLEGEYLRPGGSLSGGAYHRTGNLLARNREMDELKSNIEAHGEKIDSYKKRLAEIETAAALLQDDKAKYSKKLQEAILAENTAKVELAKAIESYEATKGADEQIRQESRTMDSELLNIRSRKEDSQSYSRELSDRLNNLSEEKEKLAQSLDEQRYMESTAARNQSEVEMEESAIRQKADFAAENYERAIDDLKKHKEAKERLLSESESTQEDEENKLLEIEAIKSLISEGEDALGRIKEQLKASVHKKEEADERQKGFFEHRDKVALTMTNLEKEMVRLENRLEKTSEAIKSRHDYMWDEYELTPHAAEELKDEAYNDSAAMKKQLQDIRDEIRKMGTVNVGAIEEYAATKERYDFLKKQHDDIVDAQNSLNDIINELDEGMRKQFEEGFKDIQREFDAAFKELFGGGKGTLELMPDEDILETGIKIIAQPPGKKLQNMMQLSGGEKSLTAISLLFAIQNLKPSPFCLLDEIEAALDDSNVGRFANYLHNLTENTQFIVITHRRGTMNAADRLYGITMQEKGISTLVSVNLIENDLDE